MKCEKNVWQGVVLEESFDDLSLLEMAKVIDTEKCQLEGEDRIMTFNNVEVDASKKNKYVEKASLDIKYGFYTHLCKDDTMVVAFKNKVFEFRKDNPLLEHARQYGLSVGILADQLCFERIIDNPFDE